MSEKKPVLFRPGVGRHGMTELHFAAYCGDMDELVRCLETGMNPNQKDDYRGYTPLLWLADMAATGGPRLKMLKALTKHGADIHARSRDGIGAVTLGKEAGSDMGDKLAAELIRLGVKG